MTEINSNADIFNRLTVEELSEPTPLISCAELYELDVLKDAYNVIEKIKEFSNRLPFFIDDNSWPSEDKWNNGGYIADFRDGTPGLNYVDYGRGPGKTFRYSSSVEFAYDVFKHVLPPHTSSASRAIRYFS